MSRVACLAALAAALALPASAFAHAELVAEQPAFMARLKAAPRSVDLRFSEPVAAPAVTVSSDRGRVRTLPARLDASRRSVRVGVGFGSMRRGAYTVRWRVVSDEGHVVSGVYTFGVGVDPPPPTRAVGASGSTRADNALRWLLFVALALAVGGLGFRLLVVGDALPPRAERRLLLLTGGGALAAIHVGIAAFVLRAQDALQVPFGQLLYADVSPLAETRSGQAFTAMTLAFALVTTLVFLAWLLDRPALLRPAFGVAIAFVSALSLSGHSAVEPRSSWLSELADWVHLCAATLWVGGLVMLFTVVWPAAPELRREAFLRFSRVATGLVALLVVAGTYLSVERLPHLRDLWATGYGHVLLAKLALVCVALLWGSLHHLVARPLLERGDDGVLARLPRSLLGEGAVGMAVLLAAAVLVDSKPPAPPSPAPVQATATR